MDYVVPVSFELTSSNVSEPDTGEVAWDAIVAAGDGYDVDDLRFRATTHRIYKCKIASDTAAAPPETYAALKDGDPGKYWKEMGPTNKWAMFDQSIGSLTTRTSPLEVVLTPSEFVDAIFLEGITADTVRVQVFDADDEEVYDNTVNMIDSYAVVDWYEYYFAPIVPQASLLLDDLPPITDCTVKVTVSSSSTVSLGTCLLGRQFTLGDTKLSPRISINNYSTKVFDAETGLTSVVNGPFSRRIGAQLQCATSAVEQVVNELTRLRDTPVVWRGVKTDLQAPLTAYGYARDWEMDIAYVNFSFLSVTIESLT